MCIFLLGSYFWILNADRYVCLKCISQLINVDPAELLLQWGGKHQHLDAAIIAIVWIRAASTHFIHLGGSLVCAKPTRMFQQICMSLLTDKNTLNCHDSLAVKGPGTSAKFAEEVWLLVLWTASLTIYAAVMYLRLHIPVTVTRVSL